jgi:hypothetical protein
MMAVNGMLVDVLRIFKIQVGGGRCSGIPFMDPVAFAGTAAEHCYNMQHAAVCGNQAIRLRAVTCAATRANLGCHPASYCYTQYIALVFPQRTLISEIRALLNRS